MSILAGPDVRINSDEFWRGSPAWRAAATCTSVSARISIEVIPLAGSSGGQSFLILFDDGSHLAVARVPAATTVLTETEKD